MANRKISDLTALTAPATGDLLPIVDISEAAAADKNKKITYGELLASAPAGSAAAPSFSFDSDPDSGLYSAGANQLAISTNGTGRLFVDASGNVGIGATSSNSNILFEASKNVSASYVSTNIVNLSSTGYAQHIFSVGSTAGSSGQAAIGYAPGTFFAIGPTANDTTTPLVFRTNNATEYMRLTASGRLGIGNSAPGSLLDIGSGSSAGVTQLTLKGGTSTGDYGIISIQNGSTQRGRIVADAATDHLRFDTAGGASTKIQFKTGASYTDAVTIDASQRVGIGTTAPSSPLHVYSVGNTEILIGGTSTPILNLIGGSATDPVIGYGVGALRFGTTTGAGAAGFSEKVRIDTSGRVGIGTTSPNAALVVSASGTAGMEITPGSGGASSGTLIEHYNRNTAAYTLVRTIASAHRFDVGGGTEAVRIDSSGRLLVGTSSSSANGKVHISGGVASGGQIHLTGDISGSFIGAGDVLGRISFGGSSATGSVAASTDAARIESVADDSWSNSSDTPTRLVLSTTADGAASPTERMRIGNVGDSSMFGTLSVLRLHTETTAGTAQVLLQGRYGATSGTPASGTSSILVYTNGNVQNTNNSYGAISDIKLKENIVDANSQWDDLKALQVRNYNFKEGQTHTQIGLVAQEVELVSPGLVTECPDRDEEGNDLGTVTKSVNYSVLYMKAVKALQEAMERIEALEADVAQLKGA